MNEQVKSPIADAAQRMEALDIRRSFCVQAPAGSGKTELLTQRILKLLAHCERPEEILAITFTRKAAAEMRGRLLQTLQDAGGMSKQAIDAQQSHRRLTLQLAHAALQQNARQGWQLLENTGRLRITTIDSFNSYISGQLPLISAFGAPPQISDDSAALYREAVRETLTWLERDDPVAEHLVTLLGHLNNNLQGLQRLLCNLLASRDQWLESVMDIRQDPQQARAILQTNLQVVVEETLAQLRGLLAPFAAVLMPLLDFAGHNLALAGDTSLRDLGFGPELPDTGAQGLAQWQALAGFLLTQQDCWRRAVTVKNGFPAPSSTKVKEEKQYLESCKRAFGELCTLLGEQGDILPLLIHLRKLPAPIYDEYQWQVLESLTRILPLLVAQLELVQRSHSQVDYTQVSTAALKALGDEDNPTDLALRLDYRIRHILVDEFQDTSVPQVRLLEKLSHGWQPDDGRTLFIVGDGMQSCYGFRNADVGLFLAARDNGIGPVRLDSLQLKVNFRSERAVVNWVNEVFSAAFPPHDDIGRGAVRYSASEALHDALPGAGVQTLLLACDKEQDIAAEVLRDSEAAEVVSLVRRIQQDAAADSIAILVRNRNHLRHIIGQLRTAGIAWNASDIDPLSSYPAVRDLLTLCRALLNLADSTAWLALLRTPWVGLGLADIHCLALHARRAQQPLWHTLLDYLELTDLSSDALHRLQRVVPVLARGRDQRQRLGLRAWAEGLWISLGGPATLQSEGNLSNIESFFQLLQQHDHHGDILDIHDFERKVAAVYGSGNAGGGITLQIMTIHKAKGLEFDHVIIPGLNRQPRSGDKPLLQWKEHITRQGERRLLLGLPGGKGQQADAVYQYLCYESRLRETMENTRLLYIGVTRAAKQAYLLGSVMRAEGELCAPPSGSLLATIWEQLLEADGNPASSLPLRLLPVESALARQPDQLTHNAQVGSSMQVRRLPGDWVHPTPVVPAPGTAALDAQAESEELPHHHLLEKRMGEIIHYCLKLAVEGKLELAEAAAAGNSAGLLPRLEENWRLQLRSLSGDTAAAVERIREQLALCARHPDWAWISTAHSEGACELPLSDYRFGGRREFVVDRTFVDAEGSRWIIDYKSSRPAARQSQADFVQSQTVLYRSQLANYARLFRELEARPVRTALFFTALPGLYEIDPRAL